MQATGVKFEENTWIDVLVNPFIKELRSVSKKGNLPLKTYFYTYVSEDV